MKIATNETIPLKVIQLDGSIPAIIASTTIIVTPVGRPLSKPIF